MTKAQGTDSLAHFQSPKLDYAAIAFRCGLEVHQQLDTGKLFSRVPSDVIDGDEELKARTIGAVARKLRATGGESGRLDDAAAAEARRQRSFRYLAIDGLTSLVELDEEPPRPLDQDALDVGLTFAGLLGARPVDEVHIMRKTVIDGSNTGGFQRTALIATRGSFQVDGGDVGVWTIALEEDSARPIDESGGVATYSLDRLGIPLIEVATAPDIRDPAHAQRTAARIGAMLRATGRVKRGLGTIRQDLNVSVGVGARVEIKGCQDLRAVARVIEQECRRQLWLDHIGAQLTQRGFAPGSLPAPSDVSVVFQATAAKSVKEALARGEAVYGLRLPKANGLLKGAAKDGPRLGRELADHAKVAAGVKGLFHSDELPAYGITQAECDQARGALACEQDDAFALVVATPAVAKRALAAVAARMAATVQGPQKEVRGAQPDDSTRFLRPMPGAARMYPETDVPPIRIPAARWQATLAHLPPKPEERVAQLRARHAVSEDIAAQLVGDGREADFERIVAAGAEPALAARILLQLLPGMKEPRRAEPLLPGLLAALRAQRFAKEALPALLEAIDAGAATVDAAVAAAGVGAVDTSLVDEVIAQVIASRADFVAQRGLAAMGPLMGPVMAQLRGKADGAVISDRLKAALEATQRKA